MSEDKDEEFEKPANEDPEGNYPNDDDSLPTTFDASVALANRRKKKEAMLETEETENPANDERKAGSDDGDKQSDDYSDEYPMKEGKKRPEKGTNDSGTEASPLNQ